MEIARGNQEGYRSINIEDILKSASKNLSNINDLMQNHRSLFRDNLQTQEEGDVALTADQIKVQLNKFEREEE